MTHGGDWILLKGGVSNGMVETTFGDASEEADVQRDGKSTARDRPALGRGPPRPGELCRGSGSKDKDRHSPQALPEKCNF